MHSVSTFAAVVFWSTDQCFELANEQLCQVYCYTSLNSFGCPILRPVWLAAEVFNFVNWVITAWAMLLNWLGYQMRPPCNSHEEYLHALIIVSMVQGSV